MKKLFALMLLSLSFTLPAAVNIASTAWTAGFMDLAGIDDVHTIAPADLRHPPEYELIPSDIQLLTEGDLFVYAGYEVMMETISESVPAGHRKDLRITTENDLENVKAMAALIAEAAGTEPRTEEYEKAILEGRSFVEENGLSSLKLLCHRMQLPLAEDLGLEAAGVFGPAPMTSSQILDAARGGYDLIIDNVHNPVAGPAAEVSDAAVAVWRNFPSSAERGAFTAMIRENIEALEAAF